MDLIPSTLDDMLEKVDGFPLKFGSALRRVWPGGRFSNSDTMVVHFHGSSIVQLSASELHSTLTQSLYYPGHRVDAVELVFKKTDLMCIKLFLAPPSA